MLIVHKIYCEKLEMNSLIKTVLTKHFDCCFQIIWLQLVTIHIFFVSNFLPLRFDPLSEEFRCPEKQSCLPSKSGK